METSSFLEEIVIDRNESLADIQLSKGCPILLQEPLIPKKKDILLDELPL